MIDDVISKIDKGDEKEKEQEIPFIELQSLLILQCGACLLHNIALHMTKRVELRR